MKFYILFLLLSASTLFPLDFVFNGKNKGEISSITQNNIQYISKNDFQKVSVKTKNGFIFEDKSIILLADNAYIGLDKEIYNLSYEVLEKNKDLYFPLKPFISIWNKQKNGVFSYKNKKLYFDKKNKKIKKIESKNRITKKNKTGNITNVNFSDKKNGLLIEIDVEKEFKTGNISSSLTSGNFLNLTIYRGKIAKDIKFQDSKYIRNIKTENFKQSSQISFQLKTKIISRVITLKKNKIYVLLTTAKVKELDDKLLLEKLENDKKRWLIDTIIIDPGHGGKDPGAIGYRRIKEKDIVLSIAKYLKTALKKKIPNIKIYMTRDKDVFVPLKERTEFANQKKGKLFISLHCNASRNKKISGFESFFLNPARTEQAMKIAAKENASIKYEDDNTKYKELSDEDYIILSMMQTNFAKESKKWAMLVQKQIDRITKTRNRGVDQAGFYVLFGSSMPSILVETGFISNPKEAKMLSSKKYKMQLANQITKAIVRLKSEIE